MGIKISELGDISGTTDNDLVAIVQGGTTYHIKYSDLVKGIMTAESKDGSTIPQQPIAGIIVGTDADASIVDVGGKNYLKLHDPYQSPAFITFLINGQTTTLEAGDTIVGGVRTLNWSTSNSANVEVNSIDINDVTTATLLALGIANDGTQDLNIGPSTVLLAGQSHVWRISALNTLAASFQRFFTVNAYWREYYGTSALTTITETDIETLTNNPLASSFSGVKAFSAGDYKWICYPTSFGTAATFTDSGTGFPVPMFDFGTPSTPYQLISVTNTFGETIDYKCHRTLNTLGGSININVS